MSRSDGAWLNWTEAATPSSANLGVLLRQELCVLDPGPQPRHSSRVSSNASSASRFAASPIACTATGHRTALPADDLRQLVAARDLDPGAVQQTCRLRTERAVHEDLQIADAQQVAADARRQGELVDPVEMLGRERLPDPQREQPVVEQALPEPRRPEPAVLVVESRDPSRGGELQPVAHGLDELVVRGPEIPVAERPGRFLAEDARRLAALVHLDDAAVGLQVAVRLRQSSRVEPQRVVVAGHERRRRVSRDRVERLTSRLDRRRPVTASPAPATQPATWLDPHRRPRPRGPRLLKVAVPSSRTSR